MSRRDGLVLVALFFVLSLVKVSRHEIWSDEAEYWDAARASHSLAELRANTRYMGQPPLNHLLFFALTRLTRDPRAMQVLNVVEATAAVAVVTWFAPFTALERVLFAFGYFPFFEYGTISRHYALTLLLALAVAAAWSRERRLSLPVAGLAALLALSSFHGTLLALALWLSILLVKERSSWGLALLATGILAAILLARPPSDSVFLTPWLRPFDPPRAWLTATQFFHAYAPLPPLSPPWWNRFLLQPWPGLEVALGLAGVALLFRTVRHERLAAVFLVISSLGLSAFTYLQTGGAARHAGALFVAAILAAWLAGSRARVLMLLALQLPGGLFLSYKDLVGPFSGSVATAAYLREHALADLPMIGHNEVLVAPVFVLLDKAFYSPDSRDWRTRPVFGPELRPADADDVAAAARRLRNERGGDVVLVLSHAAPPAMRSAPLARFKDDFLGREFWIYRLADRARASEQGRVPE